MLYILLISSIIINIESGLKDLQKYKLILSHQFEQIQTELRKIPIEKKNQLIEYRNDAESEQFNKILPNQNENELLTEYNIEIENILLDM